MDQIAPDASGQTYFSSDVPAASAPSPEFLPVRPLELTSGTGLRRWRGADGCNHVRQVRQAC